MEQAVGYYNLEVYEDSVNLLGVANVTLPSIEFMTATVTGAGMMGTMDVPFMSMVNSMKMSLKFLTMTQAATRLIAPKKHQLDIRVAEEHWKVEEAEVGTWADKFVVICQPISMSPGQVAPFSAADVSGEFEVYYYVAYRDGKQLWEIDKRNMKCVIDGVDYMADIRKALGK